MVDQQGTDLVHSCIDLLFIFIELVVEVVSCTLLGESQVGGEDVDVIAHSFVVLNAMLFVHRRGGSW